VLTLMYIAFAVLGCGYVLVSAFLGHLGDFGGGEHGGADHGGADHGGADHGGHDHGPGEGGHYGVDGGGHGSATADAAGGAAFHFPFFSPLAIATLLAALGSYGLIAQHGFGVSEGASLLVALPAALATAYGVTYLGWRLVAGSRASSVISLAQLAGAPAEVTVPIPAGGVGEAAALVSGQRYSAPAREADGREVARGAAVTVVGLVGTHLVVAAGRKPGRHNESGKGE
jgi:membrane protein implicated in regulation of membrane protease activity